MSKAWLYSISLLALGNCLAFTDAHAEDAKQPAGDSTTIVVTGYRASLQSALNTKRKSNVMLDAINADDIASFPEANLAESLQRIPGISIDRDNGEGRTISVRGLGGDFTRVRINGMEALSTAGSNDSGTSPNRSRSFDFNTFASELFNNIQVRKTTAAQTDEGSLGATVDLNTAHPFDYKGLKMALSAEDAYYENGKHQNPRIAGLFSQRWAGGKLGFLISGAYQSRDTSISSYARQAGSADYDYRGTSWAGNEYPQRAGFAAPTGTTFPQTVLTASGKCTSTSATTPAGTICNVAAISNPEVLAAMTGSDPAAYAALYPSSNSTAGRYDDSTVRIPALATLNDQELHSDRLGITSSFQMQLDDDTRVTVDYLHSRFHNESTNYQIQSVGLNRNNTNATLNTLTAPSSPITAAQISTRHGLYPGVCKAQAASDIVYAVDCGAQLYGTTPAYSTGPGGAAAVLNSNIFSVNPNNLDPYDYYNNPNSPGYVADPYGIGGMIALMGRPTTKVLAAQVDNGVADYLQLSNVDWRSAADASYYTTNFDQVSVNLTKRFSSNFKVDAVVGASRSINVNQGLLVEFDSMDRPETFTYDERGSPNMPVVNPGWNVADPTQWGIIKGFSAMRNYIRTTKNNYSQAKIDFDWNITDDYELTFGGNSRKYIFSTDQWERPTDTLAPTEKEAHVSVASLGSVHQFGQGLDVSAGTPTSFFAPNIDAFSTTFGFDCNCVNKYGDFRLTNLKSGAAQYGVTEKDTGVYVQLDFRHDIFGRDLTGNIGVREATTDVVATGHDNKQRPVQDTNHYTDTLPSLNLNYHITDTLNMRFAASKAMARPQLGNLNPAITAVSIPTDGSSVGGSITIGNTKLKPFRSTNYDWSVEWYFAKNSLVSFALFDKEISTFPQTVLFDAPIQSFFSGDALTALQAQFASNANQTAYINANNSVTARQFRDAPGGYLRGAEFNFQTDFGYLPEHFKFIPDFVKNFGMQLNATHIESQLKYIIDPGTEVNGVQTKPITYANGPWLNASPDAINFTLYYEVPQFSARVSIAQRAGYDTTFPIAAGSCNPGLQNPTITTTPAAASATQVACDSPLVNDFAFSKSTLNVDGNLTWNFTPHLAVRLEGLNLTNQTSNRYAYTSNPVVTSYASTGRQITVGVRYKY
ncbi:TonB-dependent receptor domain-containing protein [Asticcacaulis solisilvae]|uniref:TonB-dependent receptor domain-containing protein n=1 Tax=Asticcacaulis solisilvae TaxID=1217274 RepID=UPI003FD885D1